MSPTYDAIIIGAGISGITLGNRLKAKNKRVLLLEKSAGVGGRIATRRMENCTFDHGAQFVKLKHSDQGTLLAPLHIRERGRIWFSTLDEDYFVFPKGMTQFPKSLSSDLNIQLNEKAIHLELNEKGCRVKTEKGSHYLARQVYLTCPLPQSLALLKDSNISYPLDLEEITYASALVGLFQIQSDDSNILNMTFRQDVSAEVFSLSNQLSKEVSQTLAYTAVMQPSWSATHFDRDDTKTLTEMTEIITRVIEKISSKAPFVFLNSQLKKWRYSHPLKTFPTPFVDLQNENKVILLGDAFGGGSVLGAIRSANAVPILE